MKKRKGRIAQLLVMSVITLAMALSIYRNPEHESLVVLLLLWCFLAGISGPPNSLQKAVRRRWWNWNAVRC